MRLARPALPAIAVAVATLFGFGVPAQDTDMDEPEGCCWVHFWEEAGFVGEDDVIEGPEERPDGVGVPAGSLTTGACATVTLWPEEDYGGEPVEYGAEQQVPELPFAEPGSMRITCEEE